MHGPRWQLNVRLDAIGLRNLTAVRERTGESVSALILRLIREEYERGGQDGIPINDGPPGDLGVDGDIRALRGMRGVDAEPVA